MRIWGFRARGARSGLGSPGFLPPYARGTLARCLRWRRHGWLAITEMTPDREIQEAVKGVFRNFERLGTLRQVLLWHHNEKVSLPLLHICDGQQTVVWQLPNYQHLLRMLKNPTYAGAFAYGRTGTRSQAVDGRSRKTGGHRLAMDQWQVLLKDHHAAYISWNQYLQNQQTLTANRTQMHPVSSGAAREGSALLAGLLRCARCGHKLHVGYRGRNGRAPRYYCLTGNKEQGKPSCLCFGGIKADQAVSELVIEACQPLAVEASLEALNASHTKHDQKQRALEMALERARYEVGRTRRQYDNVDPTNRLVAAELEARWNAALVQFSEAEARLKAEQQARLLPDESQRNRLLALGSDLHALWELGVGVGVIRTMIKQRLLPARQIVKGSPWMIDHGDLQNVAVQKYSREARSGKATPRGDDSQTLMPYI